MMMMMMYQVVLIRRSNESARASQQRGRQGRHGYVVVDGCTPLDGTDYRRQSLMSANYVTLSRYLTLCTDRQ